MLNYDAPDDRWPLQLKTSFEQFVRDGGGVVIVHAADNAFPAWKGNALVGAMRANTGQHIQRVFFNAKGEPVGREIFLAELKQRIREVKPGPDGFLYALTDETFGAVLKIEPAAK